MGILFNDNKSGPKNKELKKNLALKIENSVGQVGRVRRKGVLDAIVEVRGMTSML